LLKIFLGIRANGRAEKTITEGYGGRVPTIFNRVFETMPILARGSNHDYPASMIRWRGGEGYSGTANERPVMLISEPDNLE
jgi:hypothetical protein